MQVWPRWLKAYSLAAGSARLTWWPEPGEAYLAARGAECVGQAVRALWAARTHSFSQKTRVCSQGCAGVAVEAPGQDPAQPTRIAALGVSMQHLPGSASDGDDGSFNGKLRNNHLNREIFYTLRKAKVLVEQCGRFYTTERPHNSLGYRPQAPQAILPPATRLASPVA